MKNWATLAVDETHLLAKHYTAGRQGHAIRWVAIHHNAGNLSLRGIHDVWQTREASAHYQVDAAGRIGRYVRDTDTAWHAGDWLANLQTIAIEHANSVGTSGPVTAKTLEEGAHLVAALCVHHKLGRPQWWVNVFPHSHWSSTACPGHLHPSGSQGQAYMARAQHWYDAMTGKTGTEAPAKTKTKTTQANETSFEELINMNSGIYWVDGKVYRYLLFNTISGWEQEYSNGTGGAMGGDYNNPLAATLRTGSFAKVSKSHAEAIKRSLADLRAGKVEVSGTVTIEGADQ